LQGLQGLQWLERPEGKQGREGAELTAGGSAALRLRLVAIARLALALGLGSVLGGLALASRAGLRLTLIAVAIGDLGPTAVIAFHGRRLWGENGIGLRPVDCHHPQTHSHFHFHFHYVQSGQHAQSGEKNSKCDDSHVGCSMFNGPRTEFD